MSWVPLLNTLYDLRDKEFENFKLHLSEEVGDIEPVYENLLVITERHDVVNVMMQRSEFSAAVEVFKSVLKKIDRNDLESKLSTISSGAGQSQEETHMTSHPDSRFVKRNTPDSSLLQFRIK